MKRRNFLARLAALPTLLLGGAAAVAAAPVLLPGEPARHPLGPAGESATGTVVYLAGRDWTETRRLSFVCDAARGLDISERYHADLLARGIAPSEAHVYVGDAAGAWGHTIYWDGTRVARTYRMDQRLCPATG